MSEGTQPVQTAKKPRPAHWLAIAVVVVLGAAGAFAGAACTRPAYRSRGLINVAPRNPIITFVTDGSGLMQKFFDSYVASQASLLSSRRIIDMAMQSPEWRKLRRGGSDEAIAQFRNSLSVTRPKDGQVLEVAFVDSHPDAAMTAVNQITQAYMKIVDEQESRFGDQALETLDLQKGIINNKLADLRARSMSVTDGLGERWIDASYESNIAEMVKLDSALREASVDVGLSAASDAADTSPEKQAQRARMLARRDVLVSESKRLTKQRFELANLRSERDKLSERLDQVKTRLDEINVESSVEGRISIRILAPGDRPEQPDSDSRATLAVLGTVGGMALGSGVVSWSRRRRRPTPE